MDSRSAAPAAPGVCAPATPDEHERRFGGLNRLYGEGALAALAAAHVVVAGIGGVGSWCAEALARSGVGALTLVDLDHVAPSNINRQVHAQTETLGQAKVQAMARRIAGIHPACRLTLVDDFIGPDNAAAVIGGAGAPPTAVIDCTDQIAAKIAMILACRASSVPLVVCGGAGGKTDPLALRAGDLSLAVHDALLGRLRHVLRRQHGYPRGGGPGKAPKRMPRMGVQALWVDQPVRLPAAWQAGEGGDALQGLSCAGYGSIVTVTAAMGLAAANLALAHSLGARPASAG